jgi:hypothetical protein
MKLTFKITFIIVLFTVIGATQYLFDTTKAKSPYVSPFIPSSSFVKATNLGLHSATSSLYWLLTIQYFGEPQKDGYQKLSDYIDLTTDLDPKFSHPYAFATLVMPPYDLVDEAIVLAKKGIKNASHDWEIAYNLGLVYHMHKEDMANAAKYFDISAQAPTAPDFAKWIAANYGSRPDIREETKLIWEGVYNNTKDEVLKERALSYIYRYEIMFFLEEMAELHKELFGFYPDPIEQLIENNIVSEIPKDPFDFIFYIDEDGRARIKANIN